MHMADQQQITQGTFINSSIENTIITPILLATDKTIFPKYAKNIAQWSIYLIIGNLSQEIQRLWIKLGGIMVILIFIYKKDFLKIKIEIYY